MSTIAGLPGFFGIPPGTRLSRCDSCHAEIYWIQHECKPKRKGEKGKISRLPISLKEPRAYKPTDDQWGQGISHFADCPFADRHHKKPQTNDDTTDHHAAG